MMIGRHVGPFTGVGPLGEGGGKLYLAKHKLLKTRRAVKFLSPQLTRPLIVHIVCERANGRQVAHGATMLHRDSRAGSRYQLGDKLGTGGMAEVYAGTMRGAEGFARRVAIKRVLSSLAEIPAFATMFIAEAQIASRLAHPNIVSVLDFTRDPDDRLFLVMEYVDGKDLASLLETGPISPSLAIFIVVEMLRALDYAHDLPDPDRGTRGVIHRDVSPQNLLLSYEGAVKVSDFGLAKVRAASDGVHSETVRGKPSYMAPEQMSGELLDGRADLYAVGVMLWEMLARRPLFAGTAQEIMAQVMFKDIARPSSVRRGVPTDLETIAMTLLARDPQDRYASAERAIEALLQCDDVPRDGRGELAHLLAERFPTAVGARPPRRSSAPGLLASPPSPPSPSPGGPSTAPGPPSMITWAPSLSGASGPSGASGASSPPIGAAARPRGATVAATALGLGLGCIATAFMIARGDVAPATVADRAARAAPIVAGASGGAVSVPPAAWPSRPPEIDAGVGLVDGAGTGSADPGPPRTAGVAPGAPPSRARRIPRAGELAIVVTPWALIWLDGTPHGQTPFRAAMPAGRYRVRITNEDAGRSETTIVTVDPDQTTTVERRW